MNKLYESFLHHCQSKPNKVAVICEHDSVTYSELHEMVNRISVICHHHHVQYGDHIGVLLSNQIPFAAMIMVAAKLGVTLVPLSPALPSSAVRTAFEAAHVKHVVGTASTLEPLERSNISCAAGLWLNLDGTLEGVSNYDDECQRLANEPIPNVEVTGSESFILTMTSGSTGNPKPIILTQRNKFDRAHAAINLYGVTADDIILAATPLYHSLAERLVIIPLIIGATSVIMPRFSSAIWLQTIKERSVTFTIAVSSQLSQIANLINEESTPDITSLRCVVSSSALLDHHIRAVLVDKLQCEFHECYGASEVAIVTSIDIKDSKQKFKSVGRAIPNVDVQILKADGTFAKPGEEGEIVCKTPMLFGGYYQLPEKTEDAMHGEYFCTGDMGVLDEDGFLYYLDRKKDLIITGGINVYPSDIEAVVASLSSVKECIAFPYPDERLGEIVAVALVPENADEDINLREVKFHCARHLSDFQQPMKYFIVERLPRSEMGKIVKRLLVEQLTTS